MWLREGQGKKKSTPLTREECSSDKQGISSKRRITPVKLSYFRGYNLKLNMAVSPLK